MFYFVTRVDRADRSDFGTDLQGGDLSDDILGSIEEIERDRVALLDSQIGQGRGKPIDQLFQFTIADLLPVKN